MESDFIEALLDRMTLEEQVSILSGADLWTTKAFAALGIPAVKVTDGPNGARGSIFKDGPSTACFPAAIALAATWDPEAVQECGVALGKETRLKGARVLLAPTVNLQRTVYNGRNFECYSEDPWLTSEMAVAYIRGVQSTGVAATVKHFVGNESEFERMSVSSDIPERALREMYLLPFERAVKDASVMAVMTGYNRVDGTFMADHQHLIADVLRGEWGFDGVVMSDWFARHDTVTSVLAGCDLEMPGPSRQRGNKLVNAVHEGAIAADAVRDCVRRVLNLARRVGSFANPEIQDERTDDVPEHRALIRRLGSAAVVLLKNERETLPLNLRQGQTVAVVGWPAVRPQIMGGGSATVKAHYRVAPLDALREACPGVQFVHAPGADLHRLIPVCPAPMALDFYATSDFSGSVVGTRSLSNGELLLLGSIPGIDAGKYSCRAQLRFVAQTSGVHAFSLVSTGLSRATLNGELMLDAWTEWSRGSNYFSFGCDEVIHRRHLEAGEVVEIVVECTSDTNRNDDSAFGICALRVGAACELGDAALDAAEAAARAADAVIVFAGLNAEWDCEGSDRPGLELPHRQNELVARLCAANPRTVVVLQSGSPLALPWLDGAPAVLQAWYPGQECGHAIADVLLGRCDPGGRLPQTWPLQLADTVANADPAAYPGVDGRVSYSEELLVGYRHHDAIGKAPRFAFGHGLSYARFEWSDLTVRRVVPQCGQGIGFETVWIAEVTVRNVSQREGSDVVQLYLSSADDEPALPRPPKWLAGFRKVTLAPLQSAVLQIPLPARSFCIFDSQQHAWRSRRGLYSLHAARSAAHLVQSCPIVH